MKKTRASFLTFFGAALIFIAVLPCIVAAQGKDNETQKPAPSTLDAWRQALPPEAESVKSAEGAAASAQPRASRAEVEKNLIVLEQKWMAALKTRDASVLSQLVSDDFTLVSPRLVVAAGDKEKFFLHAMNDLNLTSFVFGDLNVRLYGRAAVVSGRMNQSANVAGEDWGGSFLVTDVWINRDGFWQVVSRHMSLLPEKKQ